MERSADSGLESGALICYPASGCGLDLSAVCKASRHTGGVQSRVAGHLPLEWVAPYIEVAMERLFPPGTDPRQAMPPYDAMILLSPRAARNPAFVAALKPFINGISTEMMRAANKRVDLDKESPDQSAAELLKEVVH